MNIHEHLRQTFPMEKKDVVSYLRQLPRDFWIQALKLSTENFKHDLPEKLKKILADFNNQYKTYDDVDEHYQNIAQVMNEITINYFSVGEDIDGIRYLDYDNAYKTVLRNSAYETMEEVMTAGSMPISRNEWNDRAFTVMKPGKFFKTFFPNATAQECEDFANAYEQWKHRHDNPDIRVVNGADIQKYYNRANNVSGSGSLQESCMNHTGRFNLTKLYNDLGVEMVVMFDPDEEDKIRARALLWHNVDVGGERITLMDRIYSTKEKDINLMKAYAEAQGWWYKARQSYDCKLEVMVPDDNGEYGEERRMMTILGDGSAVERWPYVDTFTYANDDCSYMVNDFDMAEEEGDMFSLTSTRGLRNELEEG